jgi:exodeoxyribonuclease VII large subunit
MIELDYRLQDLELVGEVSDFRVPGSGHAYFTLKDADAQIRCVMWRSALETQTYRPEHGERILARGYLSIYERDGVYQLYCRSLRPAGAGDLHAQFEETKARLQAEGLFDETRKRPIPQQPRIIGIVTSPSTAALQDVLNILRRRYPLARVVLSPTPVQGDQAPEQIAAALNALNALPDIDTILLVRGGGSLEDLWCFNDERVVRAVAASRYPVISGVGHETDFTLADFAADLRAPTPSAAAELATPITIDDLSEQVMFFQTRLTVCLHTDTEARREAVTRLQHDLARLSPRTRIDNLRQRVDSLSSRSLQSIRRIIDIREARLAGLRRALATTSPEATLARGYSIVYGPEEQIIRSADEVSKGDMLRIRLHHGQVRAIVNKQETDDDRE